MLTKDQSSRKAKGFTLTEAAIVLGIVGLILGAIWVAAGAVYNNLRVSKASEQLLTIVQNVRSMHATQGIISALDAQNFAQAGGFPSDMVSKTAAGAIQAWGAGIGFAKSPWGTAVEIGTAQRTISGDAFLVRFVGIPQSACMDLAVRTTGSGRDTGLVGVAAAVATNTQFPISLAGAAAICSNATANNITFTFLLKS